MKKTLLYLLAALALGLCAGAASAQVSDERDGYTATTAQLTAKTFTYKHVDILGKISKLHQFEIVFGSVPTTASISVTPCMYGGTCGTPVTSVTATSQVIATSTIWDYYNVTVTWTGTPSSVFVNITGTH
jgi:hypothetical protein